MVEISLTSIIINIQTYGGFSLCLRLINYVHLHAVSPRIKQSHDGVWQLQFSQPSSTVFRRAYLHMWCVKLTVSISLQRLIPNALTCLHPHIEKGGILVVLLGSGISLSRDLWRQSNYWWYANEWIMCGKPIRVQSLRSHDTSLREYFCSIDLQGGYYFTY